MLHKLFLFFLLVCTSVQMITAQTPKIDSLTKELTKDKVDSIKVHDRIRLSWYLIQFHDSAAWKYLYEAESISANSKNPVLIAISYEHRGYLLSKRFSRTAITYYLMAEEILKKYPNSPTGKKSMASLCINMGMEHLTVMDDEGAIPIFLEGIKRYTALDSTHVNLANLYSNIINCYSNLGKYNAALPYCEKAYANSFKWGNDISKFNACFSYGRILAKLGQAEKAESYLKKCLKISEEIGDTRGQTGYYQFKGVVQNESKQFKEALDNFLKALKLIKQDQSNFDIGACYISIAISKRGLKDFSSSKKYLDSAFAIGKENRHLRIIKDCYANLYLLEREKGNLKLAITHLDSAYVYIDSITNNDNINRLEFLSANHLAEKRESDIKKLSAEKEIQKLNIQKKNTLNYFLIFTTIGLCALIFFIYKNYKHKQTLQQQKISKLETQQQLTATEAVLKGEEQERTRLAKDLHDGLGGMLSGIKYSFNTMKGNMIMTPDNAQAFERSMDMLDSSIKEMRRVAHNMMPEALVKFGLDTALKDFCNEIQQSGALQISYQSMGLENVVIDQTVGITIYRIVQELINNTMKHAMAKIAIVQVTKSDDQLSVTVEDDGRGFDTAIIKNPIGMGWSNITNRVEFLKGKLDVDSQSGKGTSVHIEINM
jgi:two-component system, NarL family, sensor kinase